MARSVVITKKGDPRVLRILNTDDPRPGNGQVLVDVKSSGVNFADVVSRMGLYPRAPKPPFILGFEAAGVVVNGDSGRFAPGDRVFGMRVFGAQSDRVVFDEDALFKMPDDMSFEKAAAIPVNYLTAYHAIQNLANVKEGETILIHSAAGGVGTAACQLALHMGATVIGIASGQNKMEYLKRLGVHHAIDRSTRNFELEARRLCPEGVDVILDPVGGKTFRANMKLLVPGGRIIAYGVADLVSYGRTNIFKLLKAVMQIPRVKIVDAMSSNIGFFGIDLIGLAKKRYLISDIIKRILIDYSNGIIRPHSITTYKPEEITEAHLALQSGKSLGKLVINWN